MSAGAAVVAHRLPQSEALAGDTIRYAADMTAEGLAAAIDRPAGSPRREARNWGGGSPSIRRADQLGARRGTTAGGRLRPVARELPVTREARRKAIRVAVLVESLVVPEWVEWTVARIDATDAFELAAVVPAAGVPSPRTRPAARRGARATWPTSYTSGSTGGCSVRQLPCTTPSCHRSPLGGPTFEGIGPPDVVVSFLPADRTAWDGPTPRHGVWAIAPMDDGRPVERAEPLLGGARAHRHRHHGRRRRRRRLHASDCRRRGARRSTVADAHARRRSMDLCTPRPALPAVAPAGRRPLPARDGLAQPQDLPPPA